MDGLNILGKIDFLGIGREKAWTKKISSFQNVSGEEICHENPPHSVTPPLFSITTTQWQNGC